MATDGVVRCILHQLGAVLKQASVLGNRQIFVVLSLLFVESVPGDTLCSGPEKEVLRLTPSNQYCKGQTVFLGHPKWVLPLEGSRGFTRGNGQSL